jgi:hypothetical protein
MKDKALQEKVIGLCAQAIDLYQEYIDKHGYGFSGALAATLRELEQGLDMEDEIPNVIED